MELNASILKNSSLIEALKSRSAAAYHYLGHSDYRDQWPRLQKDKDTCDTVLAKIEAHADPSPIDLSAHEVEEVILALSSVITNTGFGNSSRLASALGNGADAFDPEVVANVAAIRAPELAREEAAAVIETREQSSSGGGVAAANQIPNKPAASRPYLRS